MEVNADQKQLNDHIAGAQQFLRLRPETRLSEDAVRDFKRRYSDVPGEFLDHLLDIAALREAGNTP